MLGAVAVTEEQVFVGCCDGHVYSLDRSGRLLQKWNGGSPILAAPAVTDRLVYVVNQDGLLVALDARWLQPVWEARLGAPGRYFSAPVVAQGHLYVGTPEDGLQCLGEAAPCADDEIWPGEGGGAGAAGCRDGSRIPLAARVRWQFDRLPEAASPLEITASVAAAAGTIVVPFQAATKTGLVALSVSDRGDVRQRWSRSTPAVLTDSPAVVGGRLLAVLPVVFAQAQRPSAGTVALLKKAGLRVKDAIPRSTIGFNLRKKHHAQNNEALVGISGNACAQIYLKGFPSWARDDEDGVLILSPFTGAARELLGGKDKP